MDEAKTFLLGFATMALILLFIALLAGLGLGLIGNSLADGERIAVGLYLVIAPSISILIAAGVASR